MTARELMKNPETILEDSSALSALTHMRQNQIRHLLVLDRDGMVRGVLSNRDYRRILERTRPDGTIRDVPSIMVREIMSPANELVTGTPDMSLREVARTMVWRKIGCLPILDSDGRPLGILTQQDVMVALLESAE